MLEEEVARVDTYKEDRKRQGRFESGLGTYCTGVRRYLRHCGAGASLRNFNVPQLRDYTAQLSARGLRPCAVRALISPLRDYCAWLIESGLISPPNPADAILLPKKDDPVQPIPTQEQVLALLDACDRHPNQRRGVQAKAILTLFVSTGIRRQELLDLRLSDVEFPQKWIVVRRGKGGKRRELPLNVDAFAALWKWVRHFRGTPEHDSLFSVDKRRPLSLNGLAALRREAQALAGLSHLRTLTPHALRRFFATLLDRKGRGVTTIQQWMGHSDPRTTFLYLKGSPEALLASVEDTRLVRQDARKEAENKTRRAQRQGWRQQVVNRERG